MTFTTVPRCSAHHARSVGADDDCHHRHAGGRAGRRHRRSAAWWRDAAGARSPPGRSSPRATRVPTNRDGHILPTANYTLTGLRAEHLCHFDHDRRHQVEEHVSSKRPERNARSLSGRRSLGARHRRHRTAPSSSRGSAWRKPRPLSSLPNLTPADRKFAAEQPQLPQLRCARAGHPRVRATSNAYICRGRSRQRA